MTYVYSTYIPTLYIRMYMRIFFIIVVSFTSDKKRKSVSLKMRVYNDVQLKSFWHMS